jgi:hypothetical protein
MNFNYQSFKYQNSQLVGNKNKDYNKVTNMLFGGMSKY